MVSWKHFAREGLATLLDRVGLLRRLVGSGRPLVLYFHHVSPPGHVRPYIADLNVSHTTFQHQVAFLRARFNIVPLDALVRQLRERGEPSPNDVAITFDDAYVDNYEWAYPVLKKHGVPATIFIATARVGSTQPFWWQTLASLLERARVAGLDFDRLPPNLFPPLLIRLLRRALRHPAPLTPITDYLKSLSPSHRAYILSALQEHVRKSPTPQEAPRLFLSWDEMKEMSRHGITFGSHSHTHSVLTDLPDDELSQELTTSKALIHDHLGFEPSAFSYPDGWADGRVRTHVIRAGYKYAVQTSRAISAEPLDIYAIPRRMAKEGHARSCFGGFSESLFLAELTGAFDRLFLRGRRANNPYRVRQAPVTPA